MKLHFQSEARSAMSVAYYIVLDREAGFDPFINGKSLAKETRRLNKVARMLDLRPIDDYASYDEADVDLGDGLPQTNGLASMRVLLGRPPFS